ncbi:glycerol-3-phosphate dehydrogenase/oxidase [Persicobacter diffluens]|uniref:Glycerol-3-phosphate dehydrogenase n=1 Tax=Persicobacter diffluens TaxID=981 RepID=A0AAN5AMB3_9BACT|nr:glycerol-3-phosphate dehydrogenase [Persicobacter diffluens]
MKRAEKLQQLECLTFDVLVVGGGATGLGCALDAASRGYKTLLLEQADFAKGTSSKSTKLIHGGVRYLEQGDLFLVREALRERGILLQNAGHLVKKIGLIIPSYNYLYGLYYLMGLKVYDWLSGNLSLGKSQWLSVQEVEEALPTIKPDGLAGGIRYFDAQFDDSRLAIDLVKAAERAGAVCLNYCKMKRLQIGEHDRINGVIAEDLEDGQSFSIQANCVVNATGIFADQLLAAHSKKSIAIQLSQGVHLVLARRFLPREEGILIPKTRDGRVLFIIPWHNALLLGTTDTPVEKKQLDPVAFQEEIDFILTTAAEYLNSKPRKRDVLSVFAGLRPLVIPSDQNTATATKSISRRHYLHMEENGLITITGGKWTTFRKMAEDTIDFIQEKFNLPNRPCQTQNFTFSGVDEGHFFGVDQAQMEALILQFPREISEKFNLKEGHIRWAIRGEMALHVEDILARRFRVLFLDAREAICIAPDVAQIMAEELEENQEWIMEEQERFIRLAQTYLPI